MRPTDEIGYIRGLQLLGAPDITGILPQPQFYTTAKIVPHQVYLECIGTAWPSKPMKIWAVSTNLLLPYKLATGVQFNQNTQSHLVIPN